MSVLGRTDADCEGRPVIVSPSDDDQCLVPPVNHTAGSIHSYSLRVLARSKDIYTRFDLLDYFALIHHLLFLPISTMESRVS